MARRGAFSTNLQLLEACRVGTRCYMKQRNRPAKWHNSHQQALCLWTYLVIHLGCEMHPGHCLEGEMDVPLCSTEGSGHWVSARRGRASWAVGTVRQGLPNVVLSQSPGRYKPCEDRVQQGFFLRAVSHDPTTMWLWHPRDTQGMVRYSR